MSRPQTITIVGAGLVGSLLSIYLAKRGYQVHMYERRPDPRVKRKEGAVGEGRSINLAISCRGLSALEGLGVDGKVKELAIPMLGRMMHSKKGELTFQNYGKDNSQYINSLSRGWLNCYLLDQAEKTGAVSVYFNHNLRDVDYEKKLASYLVADEETKNISYECLIGTDGSSSAARHALVNTKGIANTEDKLSHGYKEFVMEAKAPGEFKIEKNALHIWPRGRYMMIALPNFDGSYTCTLFLAHQSSNQDTISFEDLKTKQDVERFFQENFADFCKLVPDYIEQYFEHPTGSMVTVKCGPWNYKDEVLLMGDASHAIVPFFGQGMNSGFEDVRVFNQMLDEYPQWQGLFEAFYKKRKEHADAIADMAIENFVEMSAKTADEKFLYQKKLEKELQNRFPKEYISRYSLVSFTNAPYGLAYEAGQVQGQILSKLTQEFYPDTNIDFEWAHKMIKTDLKPVMDRILNHISENNLRG